MNLKGKERQNDIFDRISGKMPTVKPINKGGPLNEAS